MGEENIKWSREIIMSILQPFKDCHLALRKFKSLQNTSVKERNRTHHIDVSVDEPQLLHMCHFLLQEQVHLLFVLLQVLLLRLQSLELDL